MLLYVSEPFAVIVIARYAGYNKTKRWYRPRVCACALCIGDHAQRPCFGKCDLYALLCDFFNFLAE